MTSLPELDTLLYPLHYVQKYIIGSDTLRGGYELVTLAFCVGSVFEGYNALYKQCEKMHAFIEACCSTRETYPFPNYETFIDEYHFDIDDTLKICAAQFVITDLSPEEQATALELMKMMPLKSLPGPVKPGSQKSGSQKSAKRNPPTPSSSDLLMKGFDEVIELLRKSPVACRFKRFNDILSGRDPDMPANKTRIERAIAALSEPHAVRVLLNRPVEFPWELYNDASHPNSPGLLDNVGYYNFVSSTAAQNKKYFYTGERIFLRAMKEVLVTPKAATLRFKEELGGSSKAAEMEKTKNYNAQRNMLAFQHDNLKAFVSTLDAMPFITAVQNLKP